MTYVANVAAIYATAPFMAAGLSWWLIREKPRWRTLVSAVFALIGVAIVVSGGLGAGKTTGDAVAVVMTLGNALYMTLIHKFRDSPVVLAGGVSAFVLFVVGGFIVNPIVILEQDVALLLLFGLAWAVAVVLWTEGTKLIPAAEAGLFGTAETPFAILLAWLWLSELPPFASLVGAGVVSAAVFTHAILDTIRPH